MKPPKSPIHIITDTREQKPWGFDERFIVSKRRGLPAGDYALACGFPDGGIVGNEKISIPSGTLDSTCAIERKSLDDFVGTVIRDHDRWAAELAILSTYRFAAVVVEGSLIQLMARQYKSRANPHAVLGAAHSVMVDYGIPVMWASDRPHAVLWAQGWFMRCAERIKVEPYSRDTILSRDETGKVYVNDPAIGQADALCRKTDRELLARSQTTGKPLGWEEG